MCIRDSTSVAMGQTFGAIESTPKIWDIAAAWLLLEELNCSIEWLETNPLNLDELERLTFLEKSKNCLDNDNNKNNDRESICNILK